MDSDHREEIHEVEIDAEKTSLLFFVAVLFLGAAISASITLEGGTIVKAILETQDASNRWTGVSGEVVGDRNVTPESFYSMAVTNETSDTVELDFKGKVGQGHYFASTPSGGTDFDPDRLGSLSPSDIDGGNIFDRKNYPVFYPEDSSYDEIYDAPNDTYESTAEIKVLDQSYQALRTTLHDNVPTYLLSYTVDGEKEPIFFTPIEDYSSCYDGDSCNHQFLIPARNGSDYHFYMVSETEKVNATIFIDGEKSRTFEYPGRPYNLTVFTRSTFEGNNLVNRSIRISEKEGNNIFEPAVSSSEYSSEAEIVTETEYGKKSVLFAPSKYSSPGNYNLTVEILSSTGDVVQEEELFVDKGSIEFTDEGPVDKGFSYLETDYKKGVNRLRPIAKCLFGKLSDDEARKLEVNASSSDLTLVRGIPYSVDLVNSDAEYYNLREPGSHLVMFPAYGNGSDTIHLAANEEPFQKTAQVAFTPTVPKANDSRLGIELLDSQEDLLHEINLNVKGTTCGAPEDGVSTDAPYLNSFKKRVNSIRPVLNSLFVAGS